MNFKKIEMLGFKSFADFQSIEFIDGINAIVGPNGCGKSNVADAVRWVLGEQSSKILRGTCMQDVIFKGTEKRKGLSFCEVSLYFDNTNKFFNSQYEEIVITRKLYKNGVCEYFLNKASCRLKDISDILYDSGVGKTGYSIIGQGMVDKIINAKPEERRIIFEDAAGISKFKAKKVEAEKRLERTHENVNQINLVINEIDRQLKPLKLQSETAKIYLDLKEKLKQLEVNAYIYQYDYAKENKDLVLVKIQGLLDELSLKSNLLDQITTKYNNTFDSINNIDITISELKDKILFLTVEIEKRNGSVNVEKEKYKSLKNDEIRLKTEISNLQNEIDNSNEEKIKITNSIQHNNQDIISKKHNLFDLQEKYENVIIELKNGEDEAFETQKQLFDALSKLGDVKAQISALDVEKENYTNEFTSLNTNNDNLKKEFATLSKNESESFQKLKDNESKSKKLSIDIENKIEYQNTLNNAIKSLESEINNINSNIMSLEQKQKLLDDMIKEYDGYSGSVKRLLLDANSNLELKNKIVGVVASLIKVPEKYQTAIEMSLGSAVQNIVTKTDVFAKDLIKYLKLKEYGRITFLPINTIKPRYFEAQYSGLLKSEGVFGIAKDLIGYNGEIKNVISNLLGNTLVVDNINNAVTIAMRSNYSFRIVTLDGDIINPQGSITGGSKKSSVTNILSRDTEIAQTISLIQKLKEEQTQKINEYNLKIKEFQELSLSIKSLSNNLHEVDIFVATITEIHNKLVQEINTNEENKNKTLVNISKVNVMLESINQKLLELKSNNVNVTTNLTQSSFSELKQKKDDYSNKITNLRVDIVSYEKELVALNDSLLRIEGVVLNDTNKIEINNKQYQEICENLNNLENIIVNTSNQILSSNEHVQLNNIKERLNNIEQEKMQLSQLLRDLDEQKIILSDDVHKIQDKKYQQDLALTKIDTDIETMQERVWTEYELTYSTAIQYKIEMFDVKSGMQEINRVKKEINALGNVNVNAIEDSKLLEERFGVMYNQSQDLLKAEDDLNKVIKELSDEMSVRFVNEFNKINTNFGIVFRELFGGGTAKLQLIDSDDVLVAGIDIVAEPPEKKLSNISLLSGGEKALVAIAILFAILRLRPMPFCLLDEIEAPLDEANVTRFAQYLRKYCSETQFIVISHKKPTMEHADALFGVTMEEKGVSKIVSVKLSDAIKNVEVK